MQIGSSGTLIGWKSGQTTFVPLWDRMEGTWQLTPYSNSSNMATDALRLGGEGGGEGPAWDCCYAPARNIPRNFQDLAFERRFLSLAW
jgi:hypothetical protein